jgi:hypothetical protein
MTEGRESVSRGCRERKVERQTEGDMELGNNLKERDIESRSS